MRHHQRKSGQFELFGLSDSASTLTTPEWEVLPARTRQKIIGLMARLLVEHSLEPWTKRAGVGSGPMPNGENSDV